MAEENAVKSLTHFGLLDNEAHVYLFLARAGSSSVGSIARRLATNRMNVYRTLKTLQEKGLVESTMGRPSRLVALPLANYLDRFIEDSKKKISFLEKNREEISDYCKQLLETEPVADEPKFRIVQGRKHTHDQILKMLDNAKKEVLLLQTRNGLYRFIYVGIGDKLKALRKKGVEVMVLTHVDESGGEAVKSFLDFAEVRHTLREPTMRLVLVDESEALTTFVRDDSMSLTTEKELAMWVKGPDYAKSMKTFFESLWRDGVLARQRLAEIDAKQMLMKGLSLAQKGLSKTGWIMMIPAKMTGESGVEHSFDLVAKYPDERKLLLVVDSIYRHNSSQILALSLKAMDIGAKAHFLISSSPPNAERRELAVQRGMKLIFAGKSRQVADRIIDEANKILMEK